jgi:CMP-N,N'-diacetyllegionaminic acid synthase
MYKDNRVLAVIPARKGSKRLPKKNIKSFNGKPMILWSIEAALKSDYIDKIIVSSDDNSILDIARNSGVDAQLRPSNLAMDKATTNEVLLDLFNNMSDKFDLLVLLQPTSPLRTNKHIDDSIKKLILNKVSSVISVSECEHSAQWSNILPDDGNLDNFIDKKIMNTRSQDLKKNYRLNGAIYVVQIDKFLKNKDLIIKKSLAYIMPIEDSIDIDTKYDFICAEALMKSGIYRE